MKYLALVILLSVSLQPRLRAEDDHKEKWVEKITEKDPPAKADAAIKDNELSTTVIEYPLVRVLDYLSNTSGMNIKIQAENAKKAEDLKKLIVKTSWLGRNNTWSENLDTICARLKLKIDNSHISDKLIYVFRPESITLTFKDADVREVIFTIAAAGNLNVVIDPEVQGKVTANLKDVACIDALEVVTKSLGYITVQEKGTLRVNEK